MDKHFDIDIIEQYLEGKLSDKETFRLMKDSVFLEELDFYVQFKTAADNIIATNGVLNSSWVEAELQNVDIKPRFRISKSLSLAAAVLFFTVGLWWINTDSNEKSQSGQIMGVDTTQTVIPQDSTKIDTLLMQK